MKGLHEVLLQSEDESIGRQPVASERHIAERRGEMESSQNGRLSFCALH